MRTAAILPVKRFARAKQRLGEAVTDELRVELARAMVADVMLALAQTDAIECTFVVTSERSVVASAGETGATVVSDAAEDGQSAAATLGVRRALGAGIERVLCIPGDCPALDPRELELLLSTDDRRSVVIVPDRHGSGTNGLLLSPPDVIAPSFGPDSCSRHLALARAAGLVPRVQRPCSLLLDIDTGADLVVLRERLAGIGARACRTRAVLGHGQPSEILSLTTSA